MPDCTGDTKRLQNFMSGLQASIRGEKQRSVAITDENIVILKVKTIGGRGLAGYYYEQRNGRSRMPLRGLPPSTV